MCVCYDTGRENHSQCLNPECSEPGHCSSITVYSMHSIHGRNTSLVNHFGGNAIGTLVKSRSHNDVWEIWPVAQ